MSEKQLKKIKAFEEGLDSDSDDSSDDSSDEAVGLDDVDAKLANAETDSDTSDTEESDMEVDMAEVETKLAAVNEKLLMAPYNYDLIVEKIGLLRSTGELESLRVTREKMSEMYPLSERLWLEWIQDEIKVAETTEDKAKVQDLFERAVQDYLSVEIWLEYIKFCLGDIDKCREVCERALAVAGLHVSLGSLLWDAYRDFEGAVLGMVVSESDREKQEKRYVALCRRQIALPLLGLEETFEDIQSKTDIDEPAQEAYSQALKKLKAIEGLEQELVVTQDDAPVKSAAYKRYVEAEKADKSNPARIQCLYERAVADCPLDYSLWLDYIRYVTNSLKIPEVILRVTERACRNCPWVLEIWAESFIAVEKYESEKLLAVFEKAILNFTTAEQAGTLWLKYLESLRRLLRAKEFPDGDVAKFNSNTEAAERHILQLSAAPEPNEFVFQFNMMRLRLIAFKSKSTTDIRESWKDLLQRGYGYSFRNWLQYLLLENEYGDASNYRIHLSRAVAYVKDDLLSIANLWLNFERDHGDVTQLRTCEKKIDKFLQELAAATEISEQNAVRPQDEQRKPWKELKSQKKRKNVADNSFVPEKRKRGVDVPDGNLFKVPSAPAPPAAKTTAKPKKSEPQEKVTTEKVPHDSSKDNRTVFVSNLDFSVDETGIQEFFADVGEVEEVRLVKNFQGKSKGFAYVVFKSSETVPRALALDRKALSRRPVFVSKCDPDKATRVSGFKFPVALERNKLFVKGLATSIDEPELRKLFSPFGSLKDVRLVTHRNGFSKGIAYVDFEDVESAQRALNEMDGKEVDGKVISVAISSPPSKDSNRDLPADMLILKRRPPTAFVPRSLQVHKPAASSDVTNGAKKAMTNEDFKALFKKQ